MLLALLRVEIAFWRRILGVGRDDRGKSIKPLQQTQSATLQKMQNTRSALGLTLARERKSIAISETMAT
jgi:hypothetical protein